MKKIAGALLLALWVLPLHARDAPSGCAWLCGKWVLDAGRSESAEAPVDAALQKFRQPKSRRPRRGFPDGPAGTEEPDVFSPPPPPEPMGKSALRTQLLDELTPPASLTFGHQEAVILIRAADGEERRVYPGTPHSLTNSRGTTQIKTNWKNEALVIKEDRGGKRKFTETFALLADSGLQVTRVLERPGLKALRVRAVYRRSQTQALESGTQGRQPDRAP
jgi:hypothetical protein